MIARPKYLFKNELKDEFLRGMSITYIATKIGIAPNYLGAILRSKYGIDDYNIDQLMTAIGYTKKEISQYKQYFFELK